MGKSTKPRKPYRQREIHVPMQKETRDNLAIELRMAIEALIGAPSIETYNQCSLMLAALMRSRVKGDAIDLASDTLSLICDRFERVKKIGLSDKEKADLRAASGGLDAALAHISMTKFRESVATVTAHMAIMEAA